VPVRFEARPIEALQLPARRLPRQITTVEASLRLDALASAGFGLSRNRMATLIRQGAVRLDWTVVSSPSQPLAVGARIQLEGRGELEVLAIEPTKRERFRIRLERH
jgi:RNA-binding protein YlmH